MANELISIEMLEQFAEKGNDPRLLKFIETLKAANQSSTQLSEALKNCSSETKKLFEQADYAVNGIDKLRASLDKAAEGASDIWKNAIEGLKQFTETSEGTSPIFLTHFTKLLPDAISGVGNFGGTLKTAGYDASEAFKGVQGSLEGIIKLLPGVDQNAGKALFSMAGEVTSGQAAYAGMQKQIISMAAAQGNLSGVLGDSKRHFGDLNQEYNTLTNVSLATAAATGQTAASVQDLMFAMKDIPKAMSEPIGETGNRMNQLVGASKIATAVGIDQANVAEKLVDMYNNLGASGDVAFKSLANIYAHAGDSKLGFAAFSTTVSNIAGNFKMLGDNTIAATNMVDSFDKSIKNISRASLGELLKGMGGKMQGMDLAHLGFISSQTGGPGGLAGGVQMEEAMATGKIDQVLSKTLQAMQAQFGGPVVTRKEAAESPDLAGEYYKQVKYLTDVAGIAGNRQEAAQILEAMKSGVIDKLNLGQGETGQDKLGELISRGTEQQVKTTNQVVMQAHLAVEELKMIRMGQDQKVIEGINQSSLIGGDDYMRKAAMRTANASDVHTTNQLTSDTIAAGGFTGLVLEGVTKTDDLLKRGLGKLSGSGQTTSGVSDTINGAPIEVTQPKSGTIFTSGPKQTGGAQRIQVDVTNKPIDVNVKVDMNWMGEKIKAITEDIINKRESDTNRRIGTGAGH